MIKKKMWRYYCEFCGKGGCSSSHMRKHEKHCTLNPDRNCGFCEAEGNHPQPMDQLIPTITHELLGLRKASKNCPACILSALRQSGHIDAFDFDYQAETKIFWAMHTPSGA